MKEQFHWNRRFSLNRLKPTTETNKKALCLCYHYCVFICWASLRSLLIRVVCLHWGEERWAKLKITVIYCWSDVTTKHAGVLLMVPKCPVPAAMAWTLKIGFLLLENARGLKGITAVGWPIKKHMHFRQTQVMFSSSSHCFRHSSFMFIASSESILKRGFMQLSPLHYPHPTVHIKPCFLHEHVAERQSV